MTEEQYLSLCEKYLEGDCTLQEELLIQEYQEKFSAVADVWDSKLMGEQYRIKALLQNKLQQSITHSNTPVRHINKWWYVAASVLLFAAVGAYFIRASKTNPIYTINKATKTVIDIQPGSNKAVLTLSNGKSIVLDNAANGVLSKQSGTAISKTGNKLIVNTNNDTHSMLAGQFNTIVIPRGGKYDIKLPDGTQVWLNSSSSLTFPTAFTGSERKVTLIGEAYFEVAKNKKMPFKINVDNKQTVEVLGTHFNISAYADESSITTTLLEGSVQVNYNNKATVITPGQMAVNNMAVAIQVKQADVDEIMAWKNGMFVFNSENIASIMKKISRWYDVDVAIKGDMSKVNFTGNYSRGKGLFNLLKNIELTDKVHFVVEGRRVTITSK